MKMPTRLAPFGRFAVASVSICLLAAGARATVVTGPGGQGVTAGQSSLIGVLDYSDEFTQTDQGGPANRPSAAALQPAAAYRVMNTYGKPSVNFQSQGQGTGVGNFSFASDGPGLINGTPNYPGSSGANSATGITQTGSGTDYGVPYGLRDQYVVQVDAVAVGDRIDITSGGIPGTIFQGNSLSVFFRGNGSGNASLYNGTTDTPIQREMPDFNTGITGSGQWHNYAVRFDRTGKEIELFVDETSVGVVDLTTFAGGLYQNFSNGAVGAGSGLAAGENRTWTDNFQVGGVVPEPSALAVLGIPLVAFLRRPRR
jgi:hypothetical protein